MGGTGRQQASLDGGAPHSVSIIVDSHVTGESVLDKTKLAFYSLVRSFAH